MNPGMYIVKNKGTRSNVLFLWVFKQTDGMYFQEGNGLPQKLDRGMADYLDQYEVIEEVKINRKSLKFSKATITIDATYKNYQFQFSSSDLIGVFNLVKLLPGIGHILGINSLIKKIKSVYNSKSNPPQG